jgi:CheY-like chemotaxis protein
VIFIVDDDARILNATGGALRDAGYPVTLFGSGTTALETMRAAPPMLLITDVLMPEMNGPALAQAARALWPDLPIIFISGDVGDIPAEAFAGNPLLAKPFTAAALCTAVSAALRPV